MKISGVGCCLVDYLYRNISFQEAAFKQLESRIPGDGGIVTGGLVFSEDLESFSGMGYPEAMELLLRGETPDRVNLGGPAIVALVHAAQLLEEEGTEVSFYGVTGDDGVGEQIRSFISKSPVKAHLQKMVQKASPATTVLSDPDANSGKGERSFINTLGAALSYSPDMVPDSFYRSDIILFGGTALVPQIHDNLGVLLQKAKEHGAVTVVGTVYDFRNQKLHPHQPWPLVAKEGWNHIDLLVADAEESYRLSGIKNKEAAADLFISRGAGAVIITEGAEPFLLKVNPENRAGFLPAARKFFPVSAMVDQELSAYPDKRGDTTGCGDNFLGGILASLAVQPGNVTGGIAEIDLQEAAAWGAASGGFSCFHVGGMYHQKHPGEKRRLLKPYIADYRLQMSRI